MRKNIRTLCAVAAFVLAAIVTQAQTCTTDPVTVAQMISPVNGSTLQPNPVTGAIDFTWCNASADYFVIIESVPGAHDIFFAFTGGAGGGAGQNFLNLGPACAPATPTGCIPALGETIYVTLETVKSKQILGSFQYTYTASSTVVSPAATTTTVDGKSVTASGTDQTLTLTATVAAVSTVNQGTVTFQVRNGAANVGAAVTSFSLTNGSASVSYLLPGGTAANSYTIQASYSGGTNFQSSSGSGTLTVNPAPSVAAPTTTTVDAQSVTFSSGAQNVALTATVAAASAVNEGTVTFQVKDGATNVGTAVASATLNNGSASAIYALPAGLPAGPLYTIQASYSGGTNFQASSGSSTLTVNAAPPPAQTATAATVGNNAMVFSNNVQNVTLMAALSVADSNVAVNEGTAIFQVMDGATNIGTAVSAAVESDGCVYVVYALPAGLSAKDYTIEVTYSGGTHFLASTGSGTLTIAKAQSTTSFTSPAPASLPFGGTYTPTATSTGDGALTIGASGACSIAGGVVTITSGSGTCSVTATESEGGNFLGSLAIQSITATKAASATIFTSTAPASLPLGGTYTPTAASTGDGTLTIGTSGACSIAGGVVTMTASSGTCTITATESEGNNFLGSVAAPQSIAAVSTIRSLMTQVSGLNLNKGNINSLMSKLDAAQRGRAGAARGQLGSFINEVQALQRSGRLDAVTAASLIGQAESIISGL